MQLKNKVITAIATTAILVNSFAPLALADTNLQISGNGAFSDSNANVTQTQTTSVVQNNSADISNNVSVNANTGGNDANFNTGGNTTVATGNAVSTVDLTTRVNSNQATVNGCNSCNTNSSVTVSGNGAYSDNNANLTNNNTTSLYQTNDANIRNNVDVKQSTGNNDAGYNTGGNTTVVTGHAIAGVSVNNDANANVASVGGSEGNQSGSVSVNMNDNGAFSDNNVNLALSRVSTLVQDNKANIDNHVKVNSDTGNNDANFNTGGDTLIDTGTADAQVAIDNMANFNAADLECGCLMNINAKISGNGYLSDNSINAALADSKNIFQDNYMHQNNNVYVDPKTGYNDANFNTGPVLNDPVTVITGHALSDTKINNTGNQNVFGSLEGLNIPDVSNVSFSLDFGQLFGFLHMNMI